MSVSAGTRTEQAAGERPADESPTRPAAAARRRRRQTWIYLARAALLAAIIAAWELMAGRVIDDFFTSRPSEIAQTWWEWVVDGELWYNASSTFYSFLLGFLIGAAVALVFGYVLGGSPRLAAVLEPFITGIYSVPKLALIPLFVMWFGIGRQLQVLICALVVFFLMFYNTFYGIRDVDRSLVDSVRIMGGRRRDIALQVRLPSALVWMVAGLKLSVPQGLIAVVVAEILASSRGLGHLVAVNAGQFNSAGTFAAILTLLVLGLAVDRMVGAISRRSLMWKHQGAEVA